MIFCLLPHHACGLRVWATKSDSEARTRKGILRVEIPVPDLNPVRLMGTSPAQSSVGLKGACFLVFDPRVDIIIFMGRDPKTELPTQ